MLSILIPTYNYDISDLIISLNKIALRLDFDYEILCLEDGSTMYLEENKAICDTYHNTFYIVSNKNKGRITSRRLLTEKAKYDWLLFLDADVELTNDNFIIAYSKFFSKGFDAVYGGCSYELREPNASKVLRWKYGKAYEEIESNIRNKTPYKHIVSVNFLIKKDVFQNLISKIDSDGYGYDLFLGVLMKLDKTKVYHIDNPVIHKGLEESSVFLNKVERAVETNYRLLSEKRISTTENSLLETYKSIKKFGLSKIIYLIYKWFKTPIKRQLLSSSPNIKLLQFYKLGYLCALSLKKK
ncbi:glycosyltransferase family 2 protein [Winogradskyella sp.]|uniref:glycosyltransferase family 2 protein n=1 Tax=Winogradskyella sp. TaxID=1883156 RepID=UPI003BACC7A7